MFVQNLTAEQQSALIYLAEEVAKSDNDLQELQLGMVEILTQQSQAGVTAKAISLADLPALFTTEKAKCSLLLELIGVALANDDYQQAERDLINKYADVLGVSTRKIQKLEFWVKKQLELAEQAEVLFNE